VILRQKRYAVEDVGGLKDWPRPDRLRVADYAAIVLATLEAPPARLGVTHWPSRLLTVANVRSRTCGGERGLQPWQTGSFRSSTDPEPKAAGARDVVGLYLNPPDLPWYCAWMRMRRRWNGRRRCCRCVPASREA
jgi:hypothetical protein